MHVATRRVGLWLSAGVITVTATLLIGSGHDNAYLGPYVAIGLLSCLAGWRDDRVAAFAIYLGGIVGATIVAVAAGAVGVEPGEDPAMRSAYFGMLVFLAAAVTAALGLFVVAGGYLVGRLLRRLRPETSDPL
jgi:hypothetical protein